MTTTAAPQASYVIVPLQFDTREMNRSMSFPPASELDTAVSFAKSPTPLTHPGTGPGQRGISSVELHFSDRPKCCRRPTFVYRFGHLRSNPFAARTLAWARDLKIAKKVRRQVISVSSL
jgi:hypothetical protein